MSITRGHKLDNIKKNNVEEVGYSDQGNLIFRNRGDSEWYFVFDNNQSKMPKTKIENFSIREKTADAAITLNAAGNEDVLAYLLGKTGGK